MKKNAFKAIFCYILCLALVAVYSSFHVTYPSVDSSDFVPGSDDSPDRGAYVLLSVKLVNGWYVTNAEGQNRHYVHEKFMDPSPPDASLYGDMKFQVHGPTLNGFTWVYLPFSKSLAVQTPTERRLDNQQEDYIDSGAEFYDEKRKVIAVLNVIGFSGVIVYHSSNIVELFGSIQNVEVGFNSFNKKGFYDNHWAACGSGGLYAKFTFTGDGIIAEGLPGGYTVTKYDCDEYYMELYTKAYDETGKEMPYVPPAEEAIEE